MKIEVFDPCGNTLGKNKFNYAPRLESLKGKTIGEISNMLWESHRIFPLIRDRLRKMYPDIEFVPYTELPHGADNIVDNEQIGDIVAAKKCDAVIGASAA